MMNTTMVHHHSTRLLAAVVLSEFFTAAQASPNLPLTRDTITLNPGERYDIEFVADNPGTWLLHCHELHHADMGMVAPLHYEGYPVMKGMPKDKHKPQAEEAPQERGHHGHH